jgi:integrase
MTQHNEVLHPLIRYTRSDFTALRAWLQGIPLEAMFGRYFPADDERFPKGEPDLERWLTSMRDDLIARLIDSNPKIAESLEYFRQRKSWSKDLLDYLVQAADKKATLPYPEDPITAWMKPIVCKRLKGDGILTLADLIETITRRGKGWYLPVPCLGPGKARVIETWLLSNKDTLPDLPSYVGKTDNLPVAPTVSILGRHSQNLMPMERFLPASELDGSRGANRHHQFPLISARNDYDAIQAYLYKFRGQEKTWLAYRKELERFLLWSICERGKALSDLMVDDCEAYKDFLEKLPENWVGGKRPRNTPEWRPFTTPTLSPESRKYAILVLRSCFSWLVDVRYLSANPFVAVSNPAVAKPIHDMQIHKAFAKTLWEKLSRPGGILDEVCSLTEKELRDRYNLADHGPTATRPEAYLAQVRVLRAAILLLGATGIRRSELAFASRKHLQPYPKQPGIWQLAVLGKRNKWRYVYPTQQEIDALKAHWADRGEDFDIPRDIPLLSPLLFPEQEASKAKHVLDTEPGGKGYSDLSILRLVRKWFTRFANDELLDLTPEEREKLATAGIHAFRHTFATLTADNMPLDVVQGLLGHASLNTTTIYVRSTEDRAAAAIGEWRKESAG